MNRVSFICNDAVLLDNYFILALIFDQAELTWVTAFMMRWYIHLQTVMHLRTGRTRSELVKPLG